jgi:hypothetical protein
MACKGRSKWYFVNKAKGTLKSQKGKAKKGRK